MSILKYISTNVRNVENIALNRLKKHYLNHRNNVSYTLWKSFQAEGDVKGSVLTFSLSAKAVKDGYTFNYAFTQNYGSKILFNSGIFLKESLFVESAVTDSETLLNNLIKEAFVAELQSY